MVDRGRYLTLRASDEEISMLRALAEDEGLTSSDYVRQFIRRTYADKYGTKSPKKPKQK
jgi:hypothetical protein